MNRHGKHVLLPKFRGRENIISGLENHSSLSGDDDIRLDHTVVATVGTD